MNSVAIHAPYWPRFRCTGGELHHPYFDLGTFLCEGCDMALSPLEAWMVERAWTRVEQLMGQRVWLQWVWNN